MPTVAPMDEVTFLDTYVKTLCGGLETCCASGQVPFGREACEADARATAEGLRGANGVYDSVSGAACISSLRWFGTVCPTTGSIAIIGPGMECGGVYHGTVAPGSGCSERTDCATPPGGLAICLPVSYPGPHVCRTFVADRGPGDPCTRMIDDEIEFHSCVAGSDCDEDTGRCEAECQAGPGSPCEVGDCATGLTCDDTGHCVALKTAGEPCTESGECYGTCKEGLCSLGMDAKTCYSP
jgi:hypothetical protein